LENAFASIAHDLWLDETYNVASTRLKFATAIRKRHLDDLTDSEIDYLMFKVITTMGGVNTLKFLLPRYFAAWFSNIDGAWCVDINLAKSKLEMAKFDEWPAPQIKSTLEAMRIAAHHEIQSEELLGLGHDENADQILEWVNNQLNATGNR